MDGCARWMQNGEKFTGLWLEDGWVLVDHVKGKFDRVGMWMDGCLLVAFSESVFRG